jgi:Uma2 family endonuclease
MVAATKLTLDDRVQIPEGAFDHAGFRAWMHSDAFPKCVRATFVAGEVLIEMSPESLETHNKVKGEITSVLVQLVREGDLGEAYPHRVLVTLPIAATTTEPDFTFVGWAALLSNRVTFIKRATRDAEYIEIEGTPDLVVEIVSDSSVRKDLTLLRDAYARQGISEYWIVDARGDDLRFEILRLTGDSYPASVAGAQRSEVFSRSFELTRARNRVGRWSYRLIAR